MNVIVHINSSLSTLIKFIENPNNLVYWTVHKNIYLIDNQCLEFINNSYAEIKTFTLKESNSKYKLKYSWSINRNIIKEFQFIIKSIQKDKQELSLEFSKEIAPNKLKQLIKLLEIEFKILKSVLEKNKSRLTIEDAKFMNTYHNNLTL